MKGVKFMAKIELGEKDLLNPNETILLFDLSSRKFLALIRSGTKLDFIAFYGDRRLDPGCGAFLLTECEFHGILGIS